MDETTSKPTKVYVVTSGEYSTHMVENVYSTREKAEDAIYGYSDHHIEEHELDPTPAVRTMSAYQVAIDANTGETQLPLLIFSHAPMEDNRRAKVEVRCQGDAAIIVAVSPISFNHAHKAADEKRKEWLRTRDMAGKPR